MRLDDKVVAGMREKERERQRKKEGKKEGS